MTVLDLAKDWLRYAQSDLNTANQMFYNVHPKETEISCYHSQQCAEKALKAFVFFNDIEPPWTHNLVELCQICIEYDDTFSEILTVCSDLTPYGVAVRYPNELAVNDTIAKLAVDKAQFVYDFVAGKIKAVEGD